MHILCVIELTENNLQINEINMLYIDAFIVSNELPVPIYRLHLIFLTKLLLFVSTILFLWPFFEDFCVLFLRLVFISLG